MAAFLVRLDRLYGEGLDPSRLHLIVASWRDIFAEIAWADGGRGRDRIAFHKNEDMQVRLPELSGGLELLARVNRERARIGHQDGVVVETEPCILESVYRLAWQAKVATVRAADIADDEACKSVVEQPVAALADDGVVGFQEIGDREAGQVSCIAAGLVKSWDWRAREDEIRRAAARGERGDVRRIADQPLTCVSWRIEDVLGLLAIGLSLRIRQIDADVTPLGVSGDDATDGAARERIEHQATGRTKPGIGQLAKHRIEDRLCGRNLIGHDRHG